MSFKFKRSATLALYWHRAGFVCENYRTKSRTTINTQGIEVLEYLSEWRTRSDCVSRFADYSRTSLFGALDDMAKRDLVVKEGTSQAEADAACERAWASWLPEGGFFHFGTRDTKYASSPEDIDVIIEGLLKAVPQPPFSKVHPGVPVTELPEPATVTANFLDVLSQRRTHRQFSSEVLRLDYLAALLRYTWGVAGYIDVPQLGLLPLKTSPSGGARHPEEVYVMALRVEGLSPGVYHYVSDRHCLETIAATTHASRAIEYCAGQEWVGDAAALFVMTAVFARTMWKYPVPRAYRAVLAEAGHLCQTFSLVASSLGLGPFGTMALKESQIESDLGLNSFEEAVLYIAGVGVPTAAPRLTELKR